MRNSPSGIWHCDFKLATRLVLLVAIGPCWLSIESENQAVAEDAAESVAKTEQPDFSSEDLKFFETHIRPLLAERCYKCHGPDKQQGSLRLDSRGAMLSGGDSGAAVEPGVAQSLLLEAVRYESLEMPPDGRLPAEQVKLLETWIARGAAWPKEAAPASEVEESAAETPGGGPRVRKSAAFTEEDRQWWAFQPLHRPEVPQNSDSWIRNPIDAFLIARMKPEGVSPAPEADKALLIRRATFDLWGLPPTPEAVAAFVKDDQPDAYERLIDTLLASPRYGERWARHWLDLVRYADSNGYKSDELRPDAWRYRDWVIRALNEDLPYDQFVAAQLAGDEIAPDDPNVVVATGFLRHMPYESNQINVPGQWADLLNDITDVTADVFLGLGFSCARCHDHKYDPILQKDYYRLQAFFTPLLMPTEELLTTAEQREQMERWQAASVSIRARMAELEEPVKKQLGRGALNRFPPEMQALVEKPEAELSLLERQYVYLAKRQIAEKFGDFRKKMESSPHGEEWIALQKELEACGERRPSGLPSALVVKDIGPTSPPTMIPGRPNLPPVEPGYLTLLWPEEAEIEPASTAPNSTGRRSTLARWLTQADHPLTTRVIANRLWQYHFGAGLCATPNDFGRLGEPPVQSELLDYLAAELPARGWSLKEMHRLIMTSAAYRQATNGEAVRASMAADPDNRLLARRETRRLAAEQIRDAALLVAGELDFQSGGPGVELEKSNRRSIFGQIRRNAPDELLDALDGAESFRSVSTRNTTTTPTQSLLLFNGPWLLKRAEKFAASLESAAMGDSKTAVKLAYQRAFCRLPSNEELDAAMAFLAEQALRAGAEKKQGNQDAHAALVDFCHALLNSSEFLYVE